MELYTEIFRSLCKTVTCLYGGERKRNNAKYDSFGKKQPELFSNMMPKSLRLRNRKKQL